MASATGEPASFKTPRNKSFGRHGGGGKGDRARGGDRGSHHWHGLEEAKVAVVKAPSVVEASPMADGTRPLIMTISSGTDQFIVRQELTYDDDAQEERLVIKFTDYENFDVLEADIAAADAPKTVTWGVIPLETLKGMLEDAVAQPGEVSMYAGYGTESEVQAFADACKRNRGSTAPALRTSRGRTDQLLVVVRIRSRYMNREFPIIAKPLATEAVVRVEARLQKLEVTVAELDASVRGQLQDQIDDIREEVKTALDKTLVEVKGLSKMFQVKARPSTNDRVLWQPTPQFDRASFVTIQNGPELRIEEDGLYMIVFRSYASPNAQHNISLLRGTETLHPEYFYPAGCWQWTRLEVLLQLAAGDAIQISWNNCTQFTAATDINHHPILRIHKLATM